MQKVYGYIYKITNNINNKIYIGKALDVDARFKQHWHDATKQLFKCPLLERAMLKYGLSNFNIIIIDSALTIDELNDKEVHWIDKLNSRNTSIGYNIAKGGDGGCLREYKDYSQAQLDALEYGRHLPASDKLKETLSEMFTGREWSETQRAQISKGVALNAKLNPYTFMMSPEGKRKRVLLTDVDEKLSQGYYWKLPNKLESSTTNRGIGVDS